MIPPRFSLDEHAPHAIQSQLLRLNAEIDVLPVGQPLAPRKGTSDLDILAWIEKTGYILITGNRRTIPEHVRAHHAAGRRRLLVALSPLGTIDWQFPLAQRVAGGQAAACPERRFAYSRGGLFLSTENKAIAFR